MSSVDKERFGADLRQARQTKALSQFKLAAELPPDEKGEPVKPQSVSNWENGLHLPRDRRTVERLEEILDVQDHRLLRSAGLVVDDEVAQLRAEVARLTEIVERLDSAEGGPR